MSGGSLTINPVNPIKLASSSLDQIGADKSLALQTRPNEGTCDTAVMWKSNSAMRQEARRFDLRDGVANQLAILLPLVSGDRRFQILNFCFTPTDLKQVLLDLFWQVLVNRH